MQGRKFQTWFELCMSRVAQAQVRILAVMADSEAEADVKATQKPKIGALANKLKVNVNTSPPASAPSDTPGKGAGKGKKGSRGKRGNRQSFFNNGPKRGDKNTTKKKHLKSDAFKKACKRTLMNPAGKWKQISFGTSECWAWLIVRVRTCLGVASQAGKLRTSWHYIVVNDYCSFFAKQAITRLQHEIPYRDIGSDQRTELPEPAKTDLKAPEERLRVSNINSSFPVCFTGSLNLTGKEHTARAQLLQGALWCTMAAGRCQCAWWRFRHRWVFFNYEWETYQFGGILCAPMRRLRQSHYGIWSSTETLLTQC